MHEIEAEHAMLLAELADARRDGGESHLESAARTAQMEARGAREELEANRRQYVLLTILPLVTRGMPSSPYLPWCHVSGSRS